MGTRETTLDERKRMALGLSPDEDPDAAMEQAPDDVAPDGQPLGGNEDPSPSPDGARSEGAGLEDAEADDEKPAKRGRKAKEAE